MSPSREERIAELSMELDRLESRYNRHRNQVQRAMKEYDESPDGHPAHLQAIKDMNRFSDLVHADERAMDPVITELESLGAFE